MIHHGIEVAAQLCGRLTAKLPEIEIIKPERVLAKNTVSGMQSGLVYGYIGQVEYLVRRIKEELNQPQLKVIATGGLGRILVKETNCIDEYDPDLAFKGMKIIYDKNQKGNRELKRELILASQSPRRRELLERCHIPFRVEVADIDEALNSDIPLEAAMEELAWRKAYTVFEAISGSGSDAVRIRSWCWSGRF